MLPRDLIAIAALLARVLASPPGSPLHSASESTSPQPTPEEEELFEAAKIDDIGRVEELIGMGVNVNAGKSQALINAVEKGHYELVMRLIGYGADVNAGNGDPVIYAAAKGHTKILMELVHRGAQVSAQGGSCLEAAAMGGHKRTVAYILWKFACEEGSPPTHKALLGATKYGQLNVVKFLLEDISRSKDSRSEAESALVMAAATGHLDIVEYFIPRLRSRDSRPAVESALIVAAATGYLDIVEYLIPGLQNSKAHRDAIKAAVENQYSNVENFLRRIL